MFTIWTNPEKIKYFSHNLFVMYPKHLSLWLDEIDGHEDVIDIDHDDGEVTFYGAKIYDIFTYETRAFIKG